MVAIHDLIGDAELSSPPTITQAGIMDNPDTPSLTQPPSTTAMPGNLASSLAISEGVVSLFTAILRRAESRALLELAEYLKLPAGWDGYFGSPFAISTIFKAAVALKAVTNSLVECTAVPEGLVVGPCGDGSITVEWDLDGDEYTFLVRPSSDEGTLYVVNPRHGTEEPHNMDISADSLRHDLLSVLAQTPTTTT